MRTRTLLLGLPLLLGACAWGDGAGFATVHPTVQARYAPDPTRDVGDGWQKLASNFQVRLTRAQLDLHSVALQARTGGTGATFDPSNPPPGYTVCHAGHCDREDGAQVPYAEVAAELGGGATVSTVASLPLEADVDLLTGASFTPTCEPDCDLPRTRVTSAEWDSHGLVLEGLVRDLPESPSPRFTGERPFVLQLPAGGEAELVLSTELDVDSGRAEPPEVELTLELLLGARLLDAVPWEQGVMDTGQGSGLDLSAAENVALLQAVDVGRIDTRATVRREGR